METVITATIIGASILLAFAALGTAIGYKLKCLSWLVFWMRLQ